MIFLRNYNLFLLNLIFAFSINASEVSNNNTKRKVTVFCSADDKAQDKFKTLAYRLGESLGYNNFGLVTGGSKTGLMKEVINGYTTRNNDLTNLHGILPIVLQSHNVHHESILEENLIWVETMHIRLKNFHDLSDVIVILPGGFGTLHELMDFLVHNQFGLLTTPVIIINIDGFWNNLLAQFATMVQENLLSAKTLSIIRVVQSEDECMKLLMTKNINHSDGGLNSRYWEANKQLDK